MELRAWLDATSQRLFEVLGQTNADTAEWGGCPYDINSARMDARLLIGKCTGLGYAEILSRDDLDTSAAQDKNLKRLVERRLESYPLAYLLGETEFYAIQFKVNPYVLIPRAETELLVDQLLRHEVERQFPRLLDLGTGSGCIALSVAKERPNWRITGVDCHPAILELARNNAVSLGLNTVRWTLSSWFDRLDDEYDIIVSNPPYVGCEYRILNSLRYEPLAALYAGEDGLDAIRHIIDRAPDRLRRHGLLLMEIGYRQGRSARSLAERKGYQDIRILPDLSGRPRALYARLK